MAVLNTTISYELEVFQPELVYLYPKATKELLSTIDFLIDPTIVLPENAYTYS